MSNDTNLAQIPGSLLENAITSVGTGLTKSGSSISLSKATDSTIGGIIPPDGYYIDSSTGQLKENPYEFFERRIIGYSITTEQPTEGWLTSSDTIVDQDLSDTTFTPISGTYYRHTGTTQWLKQNVLYKYMNSGIYYYNGTTYISYFTNTGTTNFPIYTPLISPVEWVSGTYYNYTSNDSITLLFSTMQDGTPYKLKMMFMVLWNVTGSTKTIRLRAFVNGNDYIMGYTNISLYDGIRLNLFMNILYNKVYVDEYYGYSDDSGYTHKQYGILRHIETTPLTNWYISGLGPQSFVTSNMILEVYGVSF